MNRPTREDVLTEEELDRLLAALRTRGPAGRRNLALVLVMGDAGLRLGEARALATTDVVREYGQLTHLRVRRGKGGKPRRVKLTTRAAAAVAAWLQTREASGLGTGVLFCTISRGKAGGAFAEEDQQLEPGKPLGTRYVWGLVHRLAEKAGIERRISPHTLRHTFATRLLRSTGNLEVVRKALGHSRITTTALYSHLVQEDVDNGIMQLPGNGPAAGDEEEATREAVQALQGLSAGQLRAVVQAAAALTVGDQEGAD